MNIRSATVAGAATLALLLSTSACADSTTVAGHSPASLITTCLNGLKPLADKSDTDLDGHITQFGSAADDDKVTVVVVASATESDGDSDPAACTFTLKNDDVTKFAFGDPDDVPHTVSTPDAVDDWNNHSADNWSNGAPDADPVPAPSPSYDDSGSYDY